MDFGFAALKKKKVKKNPVYFLILDIVQIGRVTQALFW